MGTLQFTELLQEDTEFQWRVCRYQRLNCLYIFVSMRVIFQSLLTLCSVASLSAGAGMGGLPLLSRQGRCSTTRAPKHAVPGASRSMWEQALACLWLLPSARWWSQFLAWYNIFMLLGCLRSFGLNRKYHPWVCVQKLGMIKHALMGRTGTCPPARKNQNSFLRDEDGGKDSARCFQG